MRWLLPLLFAGGQTYGCVCSGWPSAKEAWKTTPVVFLGFVERAEPNPRSLQTHIPQQTVMVRVDQPFNGASAKQEFVLLQPGHDCAPKFKESEQVLFYLHPTSRKDIWEAWGCHRTRLLEQAADDLLFLRALPGSALKNRLSGAVGLYETSFSEGFHRSRALAGVQVNISSPAHSVRTVTNDDGVYELYDLPPGKYRISIEVPPKMKILFPMTSGSIRHSGTKGLRSDETEIELGPESGVSVDFVLTVRNWISGPATGPENQHLNGFCLDLVASRPVSL